MKEKFCPEQTKCKEDTDDTWTCLAHMAEGRVRECPYDSYVDSQKGKYPCVDAKVGYDESLTKATRAGTAGRKLGAAIVEMANLMYQKNTAKNFYKGLLAVLIAREEQP